MTKSPNGRDLAKDDSKRWTMADDYTDSEVRCHAVFLLFPSFSLSLAVRLPRVFLTKLAVFPAKELCDKRNLSKKPCSYIITASAFCFLSSFFLFLFYALYPRGLDCQRSIMYGPSV